MSEVGSRVRLHVVLARAGVASRRRSEELITAGRVSVNGEVVRELGQRVDPEHDAVAIDGQVIGAEQPRVTIVLYKPDAVVTTLADESGRETVRDLVKDEPYVLKPVGRLDYHTEGVLLMTTDGELANRLLHPRHDVPKTYLVKIGGHPTERALEKLRNGVELEDGVTRPAVVEMLEPAGKYSWLEMIVTEGRNRLVRRMCEAVDHRPMRVVRTDFATIGIGDLRPGQYRYLAAHELDALYGLAGLARPVVAEADELDLRKRGVARRRKGALPGELPREVREGERPKKRREKPRRSRIEESSYEDLEERARELEELLADADRRDQATRSPDDLTYEDLEEALEAPKTLPESAVRARRGEREHLERRPRNARAGRASFDSGGEREVGEGEGDGFEQRPERRDREGAERGKPARFSPRRDRGGRDRQGFERRGKRDADERFGARKPRRDREGAERGRFERRRDRDQGERFERRTARRDGDGGERGSERPGFGRRGRRDEGEGFERRTGERNRGGAERRGFEGRGKRADREVGEGGGFEHRAKRTDRGGSERGSFNRRGKRADRAGAEGGGFEHRATRADHEGSQRGSFEARGKRADREGAEGGGFERRATRGDREGAERGRFERRGTRGDREWSEGDGFERRATRGDRAGSPRGSFSRGRGRSDRSGFAPRGGRGGFVRGERGGERGARGGLAGRPRGRGGRSRSGSDPRGRGGRSRGAGGPRGRGGGGRGRPRR